MNSEFPFVAAIQNINITNLNILIKKGNFSIYNNTKPLYEGSVSLRKDLRTNILNLQCIVF